MPEIPRSTPLPYVPHVNQPPKPDAPPPEVEVVYGSVEPAAPVLGNEEGFLGVSPDRGSSEPGSAPDTKGSVGPEDGLLARARNLERMRRVAAASAAAIAASEAVRAADEVQPDQATTPASPPTKPVTDETASPTVDVPGGWEGPQPVPFLEMPQEAPVAEAGKDTGAAPQTAISRSNQIFVAGQAGQEQVVKELQSRLRQMVTVEVYPEKKDEQPETLQIPRVHDNALRSVFGVEYHEMLKSGLLEQYLMTGRYNAVLHILGGNVRTVGSGADKAHIVTGFHHRPSAEIIWREMLGNDDQVPDIRLTTAGLEVEHPGEPYTAWDIKVSGMHKGTVVSSRGRLRAVDTVSTMFPDICDPRGVVRMINEARHNAHSVWIDQERGSRVKIGQVPMLGGSTLAIKVIEGLKHGKIIQAWPHLEETTAAWRTRDQLFDMALQGVGLWDAWA